MTFLANPHFILQISHTKTFEIEYTTGAHTVILSKNIHQVTKTDCVWFEFVWIRRYVRRTYIINLHVLDAVVSDDVGY